MTEPDGGEVQPILITGATGDIGGELLRLLVGQGVAVRAVCRREEQRGELEAQGAEAVLADFTDPASLHKAMTGCTKVFLLTAPTPDQLQQEKNAIDTARELGIEHVVRLSAADSNDVTGVPWARAHAHADQYLAASGLTWTVLRPTAFMQNIASMATPIRRGFLPQTTGAGVVSLIDNRDIAAVAAHTLTSDGHAGATYFLTGPEAVTFRDIAARLTQHLGRTIRYVPVPGPLFAVFIRLGGASWFTARGLRVQFADVVRPGHDIDTTYEVDRLLGRPARTLDDYLTDNLDTFRS